MPTAAFGTSPVEVLRPGLRWLRSSDAHCDHEGKEEQEEEEEGAEEEEEEEPLRKSNPFLAGREIA